MSNAIVNGTPRTRFGYRDAVLTVIAALLAMSLLKGGGDAPGAAPAFAQRTVVPDAYGVPNASEQRSRMIKVMEEMSAKVQSLQQTIDKGGFKVEITAMPKVELAQ